MGVQLPLILLARLSRSRRRQRLDLLQQAKRIKIDPLFLDLTAAEVRYPDPGKGHRLACRGHPINSP